MADVAILVAVAGASLYASLLALRPAQPALTEGADRPLGTGGRNRTRGPQGPAGTLPPYWQTLPDPFVSQPVDKDLFADRGEVVRLHLPAGLVSCTRQPHGA